ncbi:MAG: response regulator [Lachnospiraceae bacterium]|nr:response regulator [Lachnospiraceae bacterium]
MITISVDDQIKVAEEISKMMKEIDPSGTHTPFSDPNEAIGYAKKNHPDVAWLDIEMPAISGLELSMEIKKVSPLTNIVFVTGHERMAYKSFQYHPSGFILKPATIEALKRELENLRNPVEFNNDKLIKVQCFGNFEAFDKNGHPIKFKRSKSKEMFAYLIDRRGALCSVGELCGALFEDREEDKSLKKQIRVFLYSLRDDLTKIGASDVIIKGWNAYGVDCSKLDCDYLKFLEGDTKSINSFMGEYMIQYSWAEMTLGELIMKPSSFNDF